MFNTQIAHVWAKGDGQRPQHMVKRIGLVVFGISIEGDYCV